MKEYGELWPRTSRQPSIVDIQILRAGQLVVLCVPAELTTMAGRRLREAVRARVRPLAPCVIIVAYIYNVLYNASSAAVNVELQFNADGCACGHMSVRCCR